MGILKLPLGLEGGEGERLCDFDGVTSEVEG